MTDRPISELTAAVGAVMGVFQPSPNLWAEANVALSELCVRAEQAIDPEDYQVMEEFWLAARSRAEAAEKAVEVEERFANDYRRKLEAAEARVQELEREVRHRTNLLDWRASERVSATQKANREQARAEATEAREAKLREALAEVMQAYPSPESVAHIIAHAALVPTEDDLQDHSRRFPEDLPR